MRPRASYDIKRSVWHVLFVLTTCIHSALSQCSGTTLDFIATDTYQVFTSLNYPFGYSNDLSCMWRIEADNITDAIRLEVTDAGIEFHAVCVYDYGQVFDGYNKSADSLGKFCGTDNPSYVSTGNYMTVTFTSDYSLSSKGFKARFISGPRSSLLDDEEDTSQISMLVILGASIGSVILLLVIIMMIYTYIQAKKAKELRRNPHMHRGIGLSRVQPFGYGAGWNYLDGPAPPAYGEIYSSPMSPPPQYSELDPNPNPCAPLPGRREFMAESQRNDNRNPVNAAPQSTAERMDRNANTHFIVTRNLNGLVTASDISSRSRPRTANTGGVVVNSSVLTLTPTSLHTSGNEMVPNGHGASINIPGQTDSLPNTVAPPSSQEQDLIPDNTNSNLTGNHSTVHGQTITESPVTAQNDLITSPRNTETTDRVVSLVQHVADQEDTYSIVSEISLPPTPVQDITQDS